MREIFILMVDSESNANIIDDRTLDHIFKKKLKVLFEMRGILVLIDSWLTS